MGCVVMHGGKENCNANQLRGRGEDLFIVPAFGMELKSWGGLAVCNAGGINVVKFIMRS